MSYSSNCLTSLKYIFKVTTAEWFPKDYTYSLLISDTVMKRESSAPWIMHDSSANVQHLGERPCLTPECEAGIEEMAFLKLAIHCFNWTVGVWEIWAPLKSEKHRICRVNLLSTLQGDFDSPVLRAEWQCNAYWVVLMVAWHKRISRNHLVHEIRWKHT